MLERKSTCPRPNCSNEIEQRKVGDWWSPSLCADCIEGDQAEARRREQLDIARKIERAIQSAQLPRKQLRELPTATWEGEAGEALAIGDQFIRRAIPERWLFLEGDCGAGKTLLATELCRRFVELHGGECSSVFITSADLLMQIRGTYNGTGDEAELVTRWQTCGLLILDDFGLETVTAHTLEKLSIVLDARYRREALTLFTSNLSFSKLAAHLAFDPLAASRIMDRIDELSKWVRIAGKSRRTKAANRAKLRAVKS